MIVLSKSAAGESSGERFARRRGSAMDQSGRCREEVRPRTDDSFQLINAGSHVSDRLLAVVKNLFHCIGRHSVTSLLLYGHNILYAVTAPPELYTTPYFLFVCFVETWRVANHYLSRYSSCVNTVKSSRGERGGGFLYRWAAAGEQLCHVAEASGSGPFFICWKKWEELRRIKNETL